MAGSLKLEKKEMPERSRDQRNIVNKEIIEKRKKDSEIKSNNINGDNIIIDNNEEFFTIKIRKDFIETSTRKDISNLLTLVGSPLFLNIPKDETFFKAKRKEINNIIQKRNVNNNIVIFMDMLRHYTGGRYSIFHQAVLLAEEFNVTIIVDKEMPFVDDFKQYSGFNNIDIKISSQWLMNESENKFDLVIGIPVLSAQYAYEYAKKWDLPFYCYMFESPNYVSLYKDGIDSQEDFWADFKKVIDKADVRISPSITSSEYLKKWLGKDDNSFKVVYPCMNTLVADDVIGNDIKEYSEDICFVSRVTKHKNPFKIIKELDRRGFKNTIHIVGKVPSDLKLDIFKNIKVKVHKIVNDYEKFKIINSCKLMIFSSTFEGFGMPPMEALYFNKPVVAYDLPVLREVYGERLNYVERDNVRKFVNKIYDIYSNYYEYLNKDIPSHVHPVNCKNSFMEIFDKKNKPIVSVGILAFNCMDYIRHVIDAVYDFVDEIIIVEGAVGGMEKYADKFHSNDGTFQWLVDENDGLHDPKEKVKIVTRTGDRAWRNKVEMQNEIAKRVTGDYYVKIDADEIWDVNVLESVINFLEENKHIDIIKMPFIHFWTSFNLIGNDAGGKWNTKHPRVWRWRKSFRHRKSFNSFIDTGHDNRKVAEPYFVEYEWQNGFIFHFGYARKVEYIRQKLNYYAHRGIEKNVRTGLYENWKNMDDPTQPTQSVRSWAEEYDKKLLPEVMKNHLYWEIEDIREIG